MESSNAAETHTGHHLRMSCSWARHAMWALSSSQTIGRAIIVGCMDSILKEVIFHIGCAFTVWTIFIFKLCNCANWQQTLFIPIGPLQICQRKSVGSTMLAIQTIQLHHNFPWAFPNSHAVAVHFNRKWCILNKCHSMTVIPRQRTPCIKQDILN